MSSSSFTSTVNRRTPPQIRTNILCQYCDKIAKESKIVHQPPKINWVNPSDDSYEWDSEGEYVGPKFETPKFEVFDHHGTLGALKRSASKCHLCALLSAYDPDYPELVDDASNGIRYTMKVFRADLHADGPGVLKVDFQGKRQSGATYLTDGKPSATAHPSLNYPQTGQFEVLSLAKQWLDDCVAKHDACDRSPRPADDWLLPTRLVKVTGLLSDVISMKLCLGKDLPPGTRYLTLSHCWGGADILKLTESSLPSFLSNITLQELPQNFKDAAAATSFFGYEYIWIDSLCIIQDSVEDWEREAATMGNVYRYSTCTIAAAAAKDPHGGCFVERNPCSFVPCELFPDSTTRTGVWAENWREPQQPLLSRAWVFQEEVLSPRTLYYGPQTVDWRCAKVSLSEADQKPLWRDKAEAKETFDKLLNMEKTDGGYGNQAHWWNMVQWYTSRSMTFSSDRWPAISGLATIIEAQSGGKLVHGLWEANLAAELLWKVLRARNRERIRNGTPSWSWLSVDEPVARVTVTSNAYNRMDATVVLDAHCPDRTKLVVTGRMARIRCHTRYHGDGRREHCVRFPGTGPGVSDGEWYPDVLPDQEWETWVLELIENVDPSPMMEKVAGLVVRPEGNVWVRVGAYEGRWWKGGKSNQTITLI